MDQRPSLITRLTCLVGMSVCADVVVAFGQTTRLGSELLVNSYVVGTQYRPDSTVIDDGGFVVVWRSIPGPIVNVVARRFDSAGAALGLDFALGTHTGSQFEPTVGAADDGTFVVAWTDVSRDGSGFGVFARRSGAQGQPLGDDFQVNGHTLDTQRRPEIA